LYVLEFRKIINSYRNRVYNSTEHLDAYLFRTQFKISANAHGLLPGWNSVIRPAQLQNLV